MVVRSRRSTSSQPGRGDRVRERRPRRGVKECSASAGAERSGAGESRSASSQIRSLRSHAPTLSIQERR
eukprot:26246-Pleurochrysis_carterae.AAC.1